MCKKLTLNVLLVTVILLTSSGRAVNCWWLGTENDGDWFNADNYSNSSVPQTDIGVNWSISGLSYAPINITSGDAVCSSLWSYNESNSHTTMYMSGGTLTGGANPAYILIGSGSPSGNSTFYLSDGDVVWARVIVGHDISTGDGTGILHMTGGTLTTPSLELNKAGAKGIINLYGGTIYVTGSIYMDATHLIDITDGTMILDGMVTGTIQGYIDNSWIVAYGGTDPRAYVDNYFDVGTNKTIVAAAKTDPGKAWNPSHTGDMKPSQKILTWEAGDYTDKHTVYFGTSLSDVNETATPVSFQQDANSFGPVALELGLSYFWRVDEVNLSEPNTWTGDIWSFTIDSYLLVDDMESYDTDANRIFYTWLCGWWDLTSGSLVVEELTDPDKIHSGAKSMEFVYDNTGRGVGVPYFSEAKREYATSQDWSFDGQLKALALWFKGSADNNSLNAQLYIALSDDDSTSVKFHPDANAVKCTDWQQWNIALDDFSSVEQENIRTVYIGFGDRDSHPDPGGKGTVHFDDIIVYPTRCITEQEYDLNADCVVNFQDLAIFADGWLNKEIWY
ncbi:MAG: hypothetical protein JXB29_05875 [Sedimentisphaerales bacterium]|nr:hypothetical protein [Sedimentisphaerales bacterium]